MKTKVSKLLLLLLLFPILTINSGCIVSTQVKSPEVVGSEMTDELAEVAEVFNEIESDEDRLLIHKLFSGAAEYLVNCETMQMTAAFDPILGKVQTSYGWDREKYPELTDAVSEYLISVDYQEPKELKSSKDRKDFAKIFQNLAEATKYE
jgi:hypothetical protein